ncbi:MAG: DUF3035 domain-containing protein [Rhodoferax sp.]|nr:DUF3035 domain-containing protein [Pseudorhodobacter sp.]
MLARHGAMAVAIAAMLALTACSGDKTPNLMNLRSSTNGPDEFGILPVKALELPEDLTALPEPTLGGTNRTDATPNADAIIALGGNPKAAGGIPAGDSALVRYAARAGTTAGIRETLAAEDLEYRRKNDGRLLERLFNVNVYFKAYRKQSLDQQAELQRFRKAGRRTPSAPPANPGEE